MANRKAVSKSKTQKRVSEKLTSKVRSASTSTAKSVKKPAGAKTVSTIHLIGKRGEGARSPAVSR